MTESPAAYLMRIGTSPRGPAIVFAVLVLCVLFVPLWWQGSEWLSDRIIVDEKNAGQQYLSSYKDALGTALDRDNAIITALSRSIPADSSSRYSEEDFAEYVHRFTCPTEVRRIALRPNGSRVFDYYPYGRDRVADPENTTFTLMRAVFVKGNYWGYAFISIDLPRLLEQTDPAFGKSGMDLVIRDQSGTILYGDPGVFDRDPVVQDLLIPPNRSWHLGVAPDGGWTSVVETKMVLFRYLGLLIISLVALLLGLIVYRHLIMRNEIRDRTQSLLETNERLRQEIIGHRLARQALETSEKKYFTLFNSANDLVLLCTRQENPLCYPVIEVNEWACRALGHSRETILSRKLFDGATPGSRERIPEIFDQIGQNGHATFEMDYLTHDGQIISFEMNAHQFTLEGKTVLMTIARDVSARKRVERDLRQLIEEKDVLLKEVHHRVKNNLQVITSLIDLQSHGISDPVTREHFRECQDRIRSMALVHENLYQSKNFSTIKSNVYIRMLVDQLVCSCSPSPGISVRYDLDDIDLDLDTAIPCGFVINELVTNALKHAFTGRDSGTIHISLNRTPDRTLTLIVGDDGSGFPEHLDFTDTESLGLQIVTALSRQLDAEVTMTSGNGTRFVIRFSEIHGKTGV